MAIDMVPMMNEPRPKNLCCPVCDVAIVDHMGYHDCSRYYNKKVVKAIIRTLGYKLTFNKAEAICNFLNDNTLMKHGVVQLEWAGCRRAIYDVTRFEVEK